MFEGQVYEFIRVPFGLKISLAALSRALTPILEEFRGKVKPYVDDLLCMSQDPDQHLCLIDQLLNKLSIKGITVNLKKSNFFRKETEYVGFILCTDGLKPQYDKIRAIKEFPRPRVVKELRSLIGLTNFYQRFNGEYARHLAVLTHLLKKGTKWKWTQKEEEGFEKLKDSFLEDVMLKHPDFNQPFILQADASGYAIAAQLIQKNNEGKLGVISYASRTLKGAERNYTTTELELLAIIYGTKKFITFLADRKFIIETDHNALTFIRNCKNTTNRLMRWGLWLQQFNFEIRHIKGKENIVPDTLSRNIGQVTGNSKKENIFELNNLSAKGSEINTVIKNFGSNYTSQDLPEEAIHKFNKGVLDYYTNHRIDFYYRNNFIWTKYPNKNERILVPAVLREELIDKIHEGYGHIGINKTIKLISRYFHLCGIYRITNEIIRSCKQCQVNKTPNKSYWSEYQVIMPKEPLDLVSVDFYGPLPQGIGGVKYILVIIDNFSKYTKLFNLKRATTKAAIRCLDKFSEECGIPRKVLSDHGSQFNNKNWKTHLHEADIKPIFSSIRHPESNICERVNRNLGNYFRILAAEQHNNWAKYTTDIEFFLNNTLHKSINAYPKEVMFGEPITTPWEQYFVRNEKIQNQEGLHRVVRENIEKNGQINKNRIDKLHRIYKFNTGDEVLVKSLRAIRDANRQSSKFMPLYEGPYTIIKKYGEATYLLAEGKVTTPEKVQENNIWGKFHISLLKPFVRRQEKKQNKNKL